MKHTRLRGVRIPQELDEKLLAESKERTKRPNEIIIDAIRDRYCKKEA